MGNKCQTLCQHVKQNEKANALKSQSQNQWVRDLNLDKSKKIIVKAKTATEPQKYYYICHDQNDYLRGIIYTSESFYEGQVDGMHMANGKGYEKIVHELHNGVRVASYDGEWKDGARNGMGKYQDQNVKFQGRWVNGFPHQGVLTMLNKIKNKIYTVKSLIFDDPDMNTGTGTIFLPDGTQYRGEFVKSLNNKYFLQGKGIMKMPNQDTYDGLFKAGKYFGEGCYTCSKTGKKYKGMYKNNVKDGEGKFYFSQFKFMQGKWVNGKKQGIFKIYEIDKNGNQTKTCTILFKDDQLQNALI